MMLGLRAHAGNAMKAT